MSRSKIVVEAGALPGSRTRALRVNVSASTTCAQVLRKALEKCRVAEPPLKYQLWAVGGAPGRGRGRGSSPCLCTRSPPLATPPIATPPPPHLSCRPSPPPLTAAGQVLRDDERPAAVLALWRARGAVPHFQLRQRTSAIIRLHHQLEGGLQSFQSLIVTPTMTSCDVIEIAVAKLFPQDSPTHYELLERTSHGGEVMEPSTSCSPRPCMGVQQVSLYVCLPDAHCLVGVGPLV